MDRLFTPDFFFTSPLSTLLPALLASFPSELNRLKNAYSIRDPSIKPVPSSPSSPSRILFGADHDEVNRTLVSVLALRWLYNDQYDTFASAQPEAVRLARESFSWIRARLLAVLENPARDLVALVTAVVINDLGKDPSLALDYREVTGLEDISSLNHDAILLKAVQANIVPALTRLDPRHRAEIIRGLELGAEFNYGQLAQAENAPACLATLWRFRSESDRHAIELHFVEQLLDIAGAAGHMDWTCSRKLIEPIAQAYRVGHHVVTQVTTSRSLGLRDGYDLVLVRRAHLLQSKGFRSLDVNNQNDRALLRLMCMGGVANSAVAELFHSAWESLEESSTRRVLIRTLNADGTVEEPVVQPTYMPALLTQAADASNPSRSREDKERALRSALIYLSRVMTLPEEQVGKAIVVERDVLHLVKDIVQSDKFREDPSILETAEVPRGVVAVMDEADATET